MGMARNGAGTWKSGALQKRQHRSRARPPEDNNNRVIPPRGRENSNFTRRAAVVLDKFFVAVAATWLDKFQSKFLDRIAAEI